MVRRPRGDKRGLRGASGGCRRLPGLFQKVSLRVSGGDGGKMPRPNTVIFTACGPIGLPSPVWYSDRGRFMMGEVFLGL